MNDQCLAETSTWQHTILTTDRHPYPGGIRTHNLSRRAAADPRLRPRGHWDRPDDKAIEIIYKIYPTWNTAHSGSFRRGIHCLLQCSVTACSFSTYVWNDAASSRNVIGLIIFCRQNFMKIGDLKVLRVQVFKSSSPKQSKSLALNLLAPELFF